MTGTLAGSRVQEERIDDIAYGDTPRIVIFADQNGQTESQAGTAVRFQVTINLVIQALVQHADLDATRDDLDTLVAQIKNTLFSAPSITTAMENIASFRVVSTFKGSGEGITGDARIQVTGTWRETYNPTLGPALSGLNVTTEVGAAAPVQSQFLPEGI
jgi:hypothetical protein